MLTLTPNCKGLKSYYEKGQFLNPKLKPKFTAKHRVLFRFFFKKYFICIDIFHVLICFCQVPTRRQGKSQTNLEV